ncbi:HAD family hydrolase [Legionella waltersii]|uniref:HAD family hydrolase n=1 Tax=Legionella waltersii TaxID=66969 RepID=UPI00073000E4|nr:HAD family hydrolase [Legionella waltersii]
MIVSRNQAEYIQAILRYQGFSEDEISKITVYGKWNKQEAVTHYLNNSPHEKRELEIDCYVLDDLLADQQKMTKAIEVYCTNHRIPKKQVKVHAYVQPIGQFNWTEITRPIITTSEPVRETAVTPAKSQTSLSEAVQDFAVHSPTSQLIFFSDFDGTLTGLEGDSIIMKDDLGAARERKFVSTLFITKNAPNKHFHEPMLESNELQAKFVAQFGIYDPNKLNFETGMGRLLMKPEAVAALHELLKHDNAKFNIISANRKEYVLAMLRYQGFTPEEMSKITLYAREINKPYQSKDVSAKALLEGYKDITNAEVFVLDDSPKDRDRIVSAVCEHYQLPKPTAEQDSTKLTTTQHSITLHTPKVNTGQRNLKKYGDLALSCLQPKQKTIEHHTIEHHAVAPDITTEQLKHARDLKFKISHTKLHGNTIDMIKHAVVLAKDKYCNYHRSSDKDNFDHNRGIKKGRFSGFRHGSSGILVAESFAKEVGKLNDETQALNSLKEFFANTSRAYHNHSFASYLGDELANIGLISTPNYKGQYDPQQLITELERGKPISFHTDSSL